MNIIEILAATHTCAQVKSDSKKSALEKISQLLTQNNESITSKEVLNALIDREKLGSTAIGYGVAIPHARIDGLTKPVGALVQLHQAVHFDTPDDEGVDLLFGLLMPMECSDEQLKILALLAELFSAESFRDQLRAAKDNENLYDIAIGQLS
ncbi:MAG: PTS sugar transporter subunit IIA [Pseudomonadota bacterium]|nr:PTS sugar transporter subunit IIA [Pseudomonadota bacterium]